MSMRLFAATALAAVAFLAPTPGQATPNFPPKIAEYLGASRTPACRICHVNGVTGLNTVNTTFGKNLRERGVVPYDEASLIAGLERMRAERIDSSGARGTSDIDVLKAGGDPNSKTPSADLDDPVYGCGATFARPVAPNEALGLLLGLLVGVGLVRRSAR